MEKLKKIMDANIERKNKFESMEEINEFEKEFKINLSFEYKQFLLQYGSGYVKDNYCYKASEKSPLTPEDGYNSTDYFYGRDIIDNMNTYVEELNREFLPIADAGGGDFICIGVNGEHMGKIYYWAHECEDKNLFLIANSFDKFIHSFEEHEQEIPLDDIELFLDDDLLND